MHRVTLGRGTPSSFRIPEGTAAVELTPLVDGGLSSVGAMVLAMTSQDSQRISRARALLDSLGLTFGDRLPGHVVFRMSALTGGEKIVFGDARVESAVAGGRRQSGEAVVFTATRVIHAFFRGSQADGEPPMMESTVDCKTWARRDLKGVAMVSEEANGEPATTNEDYQWHHEWVSVVPVGARLVLQYGVELGELHLPCDTREGRAARLDAFLPSLLSDL